MSFYQLKRLGFPGNYSWYLWLNNSDILFSLTKSKNKIKTLCFSNKYNNEKNNRVKAPTELNFEVK